MRVNVVQGKKSISWANSVLPVFMGGSGCVAPEIRPELHFAVQIDTTVRRLESRVIHGFQRFALSFNRTVVNTHILLGTGDDTYRTRETPVVHQPAPAAAITPIRADRSARTDRC